MRLLYNFLKETKAAAAVEFILVFPIAVALWAGITELAHFQSVKIRTDNTAYVVANLVSSLSSGKTSESHSLTGETYNGRNEYNAVLDVADKLAGQTKRTQQGNNGVFIRAVNRCPGSNNLKTLYTIREGNARPRVNRRLPANTIEENEGIYFVAVQLQYNSLVGRALFANNSNNFILPNALDSFYVVKPRTGGLIRNFNGKTRCE